MSRSSVPVTVILSKTMWAPLSLLGAGFEVAVLLGDVGAHFFKSLDVEIDGTTADGATAGHGHARHSSASDERAKDERTGAHGFDDFVFSFGTGESAEIDAGDVVGCAGAQFDLRAHGDQELALCFDVADLGNIFERDFVFSEDGGGHAGEGRVFGARDVDRAVQRISAANDELVHESVECLKGSLIGWQGSVSTLLHRGSWNATFPLHIYRRERILMSK